MSLLKSEKRALLDMQVPDNTINNSKTAYQSPFLWKWWILFLSCMVTLGGYYCFDFPSVLHNQLFAYFSSSHLTKQDFEFQFSLFFSLYSLPNMILPWIGGILSDKIGNNKVMIWSASFVLAGSLLQTMSIYSTSIPLMLLGRFVFGLGAETLTVCTNTVIAKWFAGQELAFAMAINLSSCKLGGVLTAWISPVLAHKYSIQVSSLGVSILVLLCYLLTILLVVQEPWYSPLHPKSNESLEINNYNAINNSAQSNTEAIKRGGNEYTRIDDDLEDLGTSHHDSDGVELLSRGSATTTTPHLGKTKSFWEKKEAGEAEESTIFTELRSLSSCVWYLFVLQFIMYGIFIPFNNIANAVLLEVFFPDINLASTTTEQVSSDEIQAAWFQSIPYFLTVFLTPPLGIIIDYLGRRTFLLAFSAICLSFAHSLIFMPIFGAVFPLLLIGVSFSVFGSVIWACVPLVVDEAYHGTAYGLMGSFQNMAQFLMPLLLQQIFRVKQSYLPCEIFLVSLSIVGFVVSLRVWYEDERFFGGALRKPANGLSSIKRQGEEEEEEEGTVEE